MAAAFSPDPPLLIASGQPQAISSEKKRGHLHRNQDMASASEDLTGAGCKCCLRQQHAWPRILREPRCQRNISTPPKSQHGQAPLGRSLCSALLCQPSGSRPSTHENIGCSEPSQKCSRHEDTLRLLFACLSGCITHGRWVKWVFLGLVAKHTAKAKKVRELLVDSSSGARVCPEGRV